MPLSSFYSRLSLGDPHAVAAARTLAARVRSGTATAAELTAHAALRRIHDDHRPNDIDHRTLMHLSGAIQRAKGTTTMYGPQATFGAPPGGGGGGGHRHGGWSPWWGGGWGYGYGQPAMTMPCVWNAILGRYVCYVAG